MILSVTSTGVTLDGLARPFAKLAGIFLTIIPFASVTHAAAIIRHDFVFFARYLIVTFVINGIALLGLCTGFLYFPCSIVAFHKLIDIALPVICCTFIGWLLPRIITTRG